MFHIIHIATNRVIATVAAKPADLANGYRAIPVNSMAGTMFAAGPL